MPATATNSAPVDSGAIGRLNEALSVVDRHRIYEAAWQTHNGGTDLLGDVVESILREHTDRALAEVADQIESAVQAHRDRGHHQIVAAMSPLPDLVRAARQEQGR